jgi:phage tail sheath protein FI
MLEPKTPGVYIQEISTLPASIAAVETAIPAFVGYTEKAEKDGNTTALVNVPTRITSLLEFIEIFGGANEETFTLTISDVYDTPGGDLISRAFNADVSSPSGYLLYYSLQMFFSNGGGPCYIVSVGTAFTGISVGTREPKAGLLGGIAATEIVDEPTMLLFPDAVSLGTPTLYGQVVRDSLGQCNKLQDRFTVCDAYDDGTSSSIGNFRNAIGMEYLKYGAAYHPYLKTTLNYAVNSASTVTHTITNDPRPPEYDGLLLSALESDHPSIFRSLEAEMDRVYVTLPPSGAIAGVYARVDNDRGVWKAPANVGLNSTAAPTVRVTSQQQENLNVDPGAGKSINVIRAFAGKGILVWGARTLAGNDNEWRYIPVRRLFIFVEESVKKATEFVVFEPNDANTWIKVKAMIENFLTGLWREGALAGAKPDEAFYVKVGLGETMTSQNILEGEMIVEIGMAAVRPAEFIILKFSHKLQES